LKLESNDKTFYFEVFSAGKSTLEKREAKLQYWYGRKYIETDNIPLEVDCPRDLFVPYNASASVSRPSAALIEAAVDSKLYRIISNLELYLGSQDAAASVETLKEYGITHVLNVATGIEYEKLPTVSYHNVPILDVPEADILPILIESNRIIDSAIQSGAKVLVHCNAGVSRSASVVISYLIRALKLRYEEAFALVKSAKPDINPNEGFIICLRNQWVNYSNETVLK
jgi:protein-tyrosine phosphatase